MKYIIILIILISSCKKGETIYVETTWNDTCISKYPMQPYSDCLFKGKSNFMNYAEGQKYKAEFISSNRCILYPRSFEVIIRNGKKEYYRKTATHHKIDIVIE